MKVNRTLMPAPNANGWSRVSQQTCFNVSEDSIPQTSRPTGTPLDRMTKIDLATEPTTPYHGKMSTENAKGWHQTLVATATEVENRYDELKAFGASSTFYLEDLSQSLAGEADALRHTRGNNVKLAAGSMGLGLAGGTGLLLSGCPILAGIAAIGGCIGAGIFASEAKGLKQSAESTQIASRLVSDWALIPAGTAPPASPSIP